jgi:hypothetical protein
MDIKYACGTILIKREMITVSWEYREFHEDVLDGSTESFMRMCWMGVQRVSREEFHGSTTGNSSA